MGCGINTKTEADEYSSKPNTNPPNPHIDNNLKEEIKETVLPIQVPPGQIVKTINGTLYDNIPFVDSLISSNNELELKLRKYIAAKEVKYQTNSKVMAKPKVLYVPNESDEILNNKINIDFNYFDVIAVSGCLISKVTLSKKNVYEVKPSVENVKDNQYSAVIVRSPSGTKPIKFILLGCKPQVIIEQRPLNENLTLIN